GATFNVTLANGPGLVTDWVGLYCPTTSGDNAYLAWKYLSNTQALPPSGVTDVTLTFTAPTMVGTTCHARWWSSGMVKVATSATMTVVNPVPTITALTPASLSAGSAAFALTVTGTGFVGNSVVNVDGNARPTTFVDATHLTAVLPASDRASGGGHFITVTTPAPGGGTSGVLILTVIGPQLTAAPPIVSSGGTMSF